MRHSSPKCGSLSPPKSGPTDNTFGGGAFFAADTRHLVFDVTQNSVLESVKVYAGSAGNRTIQYRNAAGTVIQSTTVFVPAGESRVVLNFNLTPGNNYQLAASGAADMYRNNTNVNYPYQLAGLVSITGSNATNPTGFYYFFYDWDVRLAPCTSGQTALNVTVTPGTPTTADFTYIQNTNTVNFTDNSINATSWEWDFGDGSPFSAQPNPTHVYQTNGVYRVRLKSINATCEDTLSQLVFINNITLPVQILNFTARAYENNALLNCVTEHETHNAGFEIEHRFENNPFVVEGFVGGVGNSVEPVAYDFQVHDLKPGIHDFRLRQLDLNGNVALSEIRTLTILPETKTVFQAYPNPFSSSLQVELSLVEKSHVSLALIDALGKQVAIDNQDR